LSSSPSIVRAKILRINFAFTLLLLSLRWPINSYSQTVGDGDIETILTSEFVDEILWYDHSNETSSAVLSHGTIYI